MSQYTIASVKETLPEVRVQHNGKVYWACVRGRQNKFADVSLFTIIHGNMIKFTGAHFEFAWETIVDALNNDRILSA